MSSDACVHYVTVISCRRKSGRAPLILTGGIWLAKAGFVPGCRIAITAEPGRLIVTVAAPPDPKKARVEGRYGY